MKKEKKAVYKNEYVILFAVTSILFFFLFHRFIIGEYAYVFTDVGADTLQINYAQYGLFSSLFKSGNIDTYSLSAGLGMDLSSYWPAYLIPYNFMLLIAPARLLPWAVLASAYLKLVTISLVGYMYFGKKVGRGVGAMSAALAWTFSGYVIVWGQHYGFCTCMALFTIFMYFLECYINDDTKWKNIGLVLSVTLLLFSSYYFLYMIAIFSAVYLMANVIIDQKGPKIFIKKTVGLGALGVTGVVLGGVALIPVMDSFLESARAGALTGKISTKLWLPYKAKKLGAFVARFFSNNLLGVGSDYSGILNYYEAAMLSVSLLSIFAICYFIIKKSTRRRTITILAISVFLLVMPFTSRILVFTADAHRWTFMLCLLEAMVIGYFIDDIKKECDKGKVTLTVIASLVVFLLGMLAVFACASKGYYEVNKKILLCVCGFFVLYAVILLLGAWSKLLGRFVVMAVFVVLMGELAIMNYPSLNWREVPTRSQLATQYYNDGTKAAVDQIEETDDSVYRVDKTYESASENDGMGQEYNGLSVYMSTNTTSLVDYHELYGKDTASVNFVDFNNNNYLQSALMGAKYLLTNAGYNPSSDTYTYEGEADGKEIYENNFALPFGYLYEDSWDKDEIEDMTDLERTLAGLKGFYYTDGEGENADDELGNTYEEATLANADTTSLLDKLDEAADCSANADRSGITITDMAADPNITFNNVENLFSDDDKIYGFSMTVQADKEVSMSVYYQVKGDQGFSQDKICIFPITKKENTYEYVIPGGITELRVDVNTPVTVDSLVITDFSVKAYDKDDAGFTELRDSDVSSISFSDSTYTAQVVNDDTNNRMLCVPLFYQKGWQAWIDGEKAKVENINEGLVGLEISSGEHQVVIKYKTPYMKIGICMTIVGVLLIIMAITYQILHKTCHLCKKGENR